jgi:hypothetical protein
VHIRVKYKAISIMSQTRFIVLMLFLSSGGGMFVQVSKNQNRLCLECEPILILAITTNMLRTTHAKYKKFSVFNVLVSTIGFINIILEVNQLGLFDMTSNNTKFSHTLAFMAFV